MTEADRETEALILDLLADARPDDGVLGEEGASKSGTSGLNWVVDPIDGTVNFLYGIPHYAVSIAVVEGDPDPLTWTGARRLRRESGVGRGVLGCSRRRRVPR